MRPPLLHTPHAQLDSSAERLRALAAWLAETSVPELAAAALHAASEIDASSGTEAPDASPGRPETTRPRSADRSLQGEP